jgi:hypothetical protein
MGHGNVHDNNVGSQLFGKPDGFAAIGGFANHLDSRVGLEQKPKTFANYSVIVGNKYFRGGGHGTASEEVIGRSGVSLEPKTCMASILFSVC